MQQRRAKKTVSTPQQKDRSDWADLSADSLRFKLLKAWETVANCRRDRRDARSRYERTGETLKQAQADILYLRELITRADRRESNVIPIATRRA